MHQEVCAARLSGSWMNPRLVGQERGSILIITALCLVVLMGITALAIDASSQFDMRHRLAAAADAAALAAALEYQRASTVLSDAILTDYAKKEVAFHNFTVDVDVTMTLRHPPVAPSSFEDNPNYVEVILTRNVPTFFMRLFGRSSMSVSAQSVAGVGVSPDCVIALASSGKE